MVILILGETASGKSERAEKLAVGISNGDLYYVATMLPHGKEGGERVRRHRASREGAGFITVEKPVNVSEIKPPPNATVLLEDVSNLLANSIFDAKSDVEGVFADIRGLCENRDNGGNTVIVSIDGLTPKKEYNSETAQYIAALNALNAKLADYADAVLVMRGGTSHVVKGERDAFD